MQKNLKVSVTVITYNGVKYIEQQLTSILNQTVKPDEVIISDDGSTDGSIELMNQIIEKYFDSGITITLLTDNPNHGIGPNFSWAVQHTTGDIIFSSGQDDIWREDKIEKVLEVYNQHPDAQVVVTDLALIDTDGKPYTGKTHPIYIDKYGLKEGEIIKLERAKYLCAAETVTIIVGPVISFKRSLYDLVIPLPISFSEDQWIEFIGIAENSMYYLNERTTYYRVHDSASNSVDISLHIRFQRMLDRTKIAYKTPMNPYCYGKAIQEYFNNHNDDFDGRQEAIDVLNTTIEIASTQIKYIKMNRLLGAFNILKMYIRDVRYRKSGFQSFIVCLFYILLFSKKRRNIEIESELAKCNY